MKIYKIKSLALILMSVLILGSCEKWINTDLNVDPDSPTIVPKALILPAIQARMGYSLGGNDAVLTTNNWMQYFNGFARQQYTISKHQFLPSDCNNLWNAIYAGILKDALVLKQMAKSEGQFSDLKPNGHYEAIANIHIAVTLGITTDLWGDIPYSNAFGGENGEYNATFDTQQSIYTTIQTLLSDAITLLAVAADPTDVVKGDMVFNGNAAKWTKVAYALKARYAMNLSKVNGNAAATEALGYISNALASNADNFIIPFGTGDRAANPLYQFNLERADANMSETYVNMLNTASDPRINFTATLIGGVAVGAPQATETSGVSLMGTAIAGKSTSVILMSYAELKFIEAEANLMLGNAAPALAAFKAATAASVLQQTGAANTTWLDANINNKASVSLTDVMTQKYISSIATVQAYNDWRRTGIPALSAPASAIGQIPRRYPYPQEEVTYNENTPKDLTINSKNWWDK